MLDYLTIVRLSQQGESKNSIAKALGVKWDTVDRVLEGCKEQWGGLESLVKPKSIGQSIKGKILEHSIVVEMAGEDLRFYDPKNENLL